MKIYTYWVSKNNEAIPQYIKLCMLSWSRAIPDVDIEIINHENIQHYLPPEMLTPSFYALSLAMQSDVVSVWVLMERGGIFMDADTIMFKNPFTDDVFHGNKLTAFGYPKKKSIHIAVLASLTPRNALLIRWAREIMVRLTSPLPHAIPWDYVGNAIINPLLRDVENEPYYHIIDAASSGNILEASVDNDDPFQRYIIYYFSAPGEEFDAIKEKAFCGLVSLHNSWTPESYKNGSLKMILLTRDKYRLSFLLAKLCL